MVETVNRDQSQLESEKLEMTSWGQRGNEQR